MKIELKVTDMIVVSVIDKATGNLDNYMVTNRPRWNRDSKCILEDWLIHIEVFQLGVFGKAKHIFYSVEEFENAIDI